jgi:hypothetical protein
MIKRTVYFISAIIFLLTLFSLINQVTPVNSAGSETIRQGTEPNVIELTISPAEKNEETGQVYIPGGTKKIDTLTIRGLVPNGCYMVKNQKPSGSGFTGSFLSQEGGSLCRTASGAVYDEGDGDICNQNPHRKDADEYGEATNCVEASKWGPNDFLRATGSGTLQLIDICEDMHGVSSSCSGEGEFNEGETYSFGVYRVILPALRGTEKDRDYDPNDDGEQTFSEYCPPNQEGLGSADIDTCDIRGVIANSVFNLVVGPEDPLPVPPEATASAIDTPFGRIRTDPVGFATDVVTIGVAIAGGVAFLLMIYGSFRLMFAAGNPESVQQGREIITAAIIGLIVVVFSVFILNLIGVSILGLPIPGS